MKAGTYNHYSVEGGSVRVWLWVTNSNPRHRFKIKKTTLQEHVENLLDSAEEQGIDLEDFVWSHEEVAKALREVYLERMSESS